MHNSPGNVFPQRAHELPGTPPRPHPRRPIPRLSVDADSAAEEAGWGRRRSGRYCGRCSGVLVACGRMLFLAGRGDRIVGERLPLPTAPRGIVEAKGTISRSCEAARPVAVHASWKPKPEPKLRLRAASALKTKTSRAPMTPMLSRAQSTRSKGARTRLFVALYMDGGHRHLSKGMVAQSTSKVPFFVLESRRWTIGGQANSLDR